MLKLTTLQPVPLSNLIAYPEPLHSPSSYLHEMRSLASYLEPITSSTGEQSPALFLDQLPDSPAVPSSSFFDEFPVPEPMSRPITRATSKSPVLSRQEPSPSASTADENVKKKSTRWNIPNEERPRRFRARHYCSKCLVDFTNKMKLSEHLIKEHQINRPFDCDVCGRTFRSALNVNRHKRLHDADAPHFSCDRCDYVTEQKSNLVIHKRRHDKDYTYRCQVCNAGFMQRTKFQEHKALHDGQAGSHRCKHCRRSFCYRRNLTQHLRDCHPETLAEPVELKSRIPCGQCKKTFVKEQTLRRHLKTRHSQPQEKSSCEECGAVLSCKSALVQHMRGHRGEKVAVCDDCGKSFAKWQNLRIHQRIHTGERPYACEFCDRAFAQKTSLVYHTRTHTGERPYKCDQCGKGFVSGSLLRKHAKKHEKKV